MPTELASNSSKFGALSRPNGRLDVHLSIESSGATRVVKFHWREQGGPRVDPPIRRGFATTLLEKVLTVQCDAKINVDYRPEGLVFTMAFPLRETRLVPSYS
jgi:two-component sensor histidine kinase